VDFPISRNAIKPRLEKALAGRGWKIQAVETVDDNLWWNEVWSVESIWAPSGFRVFIAFEFDDVWESLGVATEPPVNHHDTVWRAGLDLDQTWKAEFLSFLADIDRIREEAKGSVS
jgi:hypothetical protein